MRTESNTVDVPASPHRLHTIDVSDDELGLISSLIVAHIARINSLIRSSAAGAFDALTLERLHDEIRAGATLLGRLPLSRKEP